MRLPPPPISGVVAALERALARSPWYLCPVRPAAPDDDAGVIGAALAGVERIVLVS